MSKSPIGKYSEWLRALENPYAYADLLVSLEDADGNELTLSPETQISASRKLLQNPYAYLDGSGGYSFGAGITEDVTIPQASESPRIDQIPSKSPFRTAKQVRHSDREIEAKARDLHKLLWKERSSIWGHRLPTDPVDVLDPAVALQLIGYECDLDEGIGQYRVGGVLLEVAGLIDTASKTVRVSRQFPPSVQMFTVAHELGHAVLHGAHTGVHRDRPLDGGMRSREPLELEADKFATYFLMPAKLVKSRFSRIFQTDKFSLNEETSFALAGTSLLEIQQRCRIGRELSLLVASAERYNRQHFRSLASQFRVSIAAMAIRLEELSLVDG